MTYHRDGMPDRTAATTWTFEPMPLTGGMGFTAQVSIEDGWLPARTTLSTSLVSPSPGGHISSQGDYVSPRGCSGAIGSWGTAMETRIEANFTGHDCPA